MTAGADSTFVFNSPAGRLVALEPPRDVVGDTQEWLSEWADERSLDLGPDANMPRWDGRPPDYKIAVEELLAAGQ